MTPLIGVLITIIFFNFRLPPSKSPPYIISVLIIFYFCMLNIKTRIGMVARDLGDNFVSDPSLPDL
jgi:hypothetical protein